MTSWDKNNKINHRQSWEGEPDKFSSGNMWDFKKAECDKKYTNEMRLEAQKRGVYIDTYCLENDNEINDHLVHKYTPYNNVHLREAWLVIRHPVATWQIAGREGLRSLSKGYLYRKRSGNDTATIAERFSQAGGIGIDRRGGLAFSYYQKFDIDRDTGRGPGDGTENNAARHTLWNMFNTNLIGLAGLAPENVAASKEIVDLHEANPYALKNKKFIFDPDDYKQSSSNPNRQGCSANLTPSQCALAQADETTDLLNNQIGRNLGLKYPMASDYKVLALGMLDQFYIDGLYTIKKIGGKYHVVKTRITKEQYEHMRNVYINELDELGKEKNNYTYPLNWRENTVI